MYVAKVKIGSKNIGDEVSEDFIGKDNVEKYLAKGYIAEAEKAKKAPRKGK